MVDPEPGAYRPRRAFLEPDRGTEEPKDEQFNRPNGNHTEGVTNGVRPRAVRSRALIEPPQPPREEPVPAPYSPSTAIPAPVAEPETTTAPEPSPAEPAGSDWASSRRSIFADLPDDEVAPPLYRDGGASPRVGNEAAAAPASDELEADDDADTGRQTWVRPALAGVNRRPRTGAPESTTILPRTSSGSRNTGDWQDSIDDLADFDSDGSRFGGKNTRLALLIAGIAAVVAIGIAIGYAVINNGGTPTPSPNPPSTGTSAAPGPGPSGGQPGELLTDDSMLSAKDAKRVSDRTWKVAVTQRGIAPDSASAACLGGDLVDKPASAQTILRLLSTSGKQPPGILHEADAFNSNEEAALAYAVTAKTLGGCSEVGGYVESGWNVSGLGNQAVGLVITMVNGGKVEHHSVVLNRTGRVTNVIDVAKAGDPVEIGKVASALAAATAAQCTKAGGDCPGDLSVKPAPPPVGGDEPGFLAAGDLPPVGEVASLWVGDAPDVPREDFVGAQCENTNWAKTPATARAARTYLLEEGGDPGFGLDEIVLTMKSDKAAADFVSELRKTVANCPKRKLTATVRSPASASGPGAKSVKIGGWAATVTQKVSNGSLKYRLGVVAAGPKVVYTFLSPKGKLDVTDGQWRTIAVRAGQRATQIS